MLQFVFSIYFIYLFFGFVCLFFSVGRILIQKYQISESRMNFCCWWWSWHCCLNLMMELVFLMLLVVLKLGVGVVGVGIEFQISGYIKG